MATSSKDGDNVRVIVRCRPLSSKEKANHEESVVSVDSSSGAVSILRVDKVPEISKAPNRSFTFDHVFGPGSTQTEVFQNAIQSLIDATLEGYNSTIFAYGQTGSGKTFTMSGDKDNPGIIPNTFRHIFAAIAEAANEEAQFILTASYLEIYNEIICDLTVDPKSKGTGQNLKLEEHPERGVVVQGLREQIVHSEATVEKILSYGATLRHVAATEMNEHSSRSHSIFQVRIECGRMVEGQQRIHVGRLNLVDLAGSERQKKTEVEGVNLKEAGNINLSLTKLGMVIRSLVAGDSHIPYRSSKLTRLLQDSLGGNAKTIMIANLSPAFSNCAETLSTLRYADSAKQIKNKPVINEDPKDALLRKMQEQIERLEEQLKKVKDLEREKDKSISDNQGGQAASMATPAERAKRREQVIQTQIIYKDGASEAEIEAAKEEMRKKLEEEERMQDEELKRKEDEIARAARKAEDMKQNITKMKDVLLTGKDLKKKLRRQDKKLKEAKVLLADTQQKEELLKAEIKRRDAEERRFREECGQLQTTVQSKESQLASAKEHAGELEVDVKELRKRLGDERDMLYEESRESSRRLQLYQTIISLLVPREHAERVVNNATWDEDTEKWVCRTSITANNTDALLEAYMTAIPSLRKVCPVCGTKMPTEYSSHPTEYLPKYPTADYVLVKSIEDPLSFRFRETNPVDLALEVPDGQNELDEDEFGEE